MKDILSQVLSLVSVVLIPFIPNNTMRYIALVIVSVVSATYLVRQNSPTCLVARLVASIKEMDALLETAVNECTRDPRFIFEVGLKLAELKYAASNLHTRALSTKYVAWKEYAYHLGSLALSIIECRREMINLRASITLALEFARQQKLEEEINHRTATLVVNFSGDSGGGDQRDLQRRRSKTSRPASEEQLYLREIEEKPLKVQPEEAIGWMWNGGIRP
ncbi:hypothetical protein B0H17DRAFT_1128066 [Mycena rosella]|uniref:Uncharacterized protein n=1 Tax=Mycena rosella TaxID=1033263 RepID=A0AAD7DY61_MYCRO|nr:hypothetical protein B0H17DRAFT_1128066 [Mycena rosella]